MAWERGGLRLPTRNSTGQGGWLEGGISGQTTAAAQRVSGGRRLEGQQGKGLFLRAGRGLVRVRVRVALSSPIPSLLCSMLESADSAPSSARWLESTLLGGKHPRVIAIPHFIKEHTHTHTILLQGAVHASQEDRPWGLDSP